MQHYNLSPDCIIFEAMEQHFVLINLKLMANAYQALDLQTYFCLLLL
jgi:hypothetical protein